jgi:carboxypeptidase Q
MRSCGRLPIIPMALASILTAMACGGDGDSGQQRGALSGDGLLPNLPASLAPDGGSTAQPGLASAIDHLLRGPDLRREVEALTGVAPHRRAGTPNEIVARDWVYSKFIEANLSNVRIETTPYVSWLPKQISLGEVTSQGTSPIDVRPLIGCLGTLPGGLKGQVVFVNYGNAADYQALSPLNYVGKIHLAKRGGGTHRSDKYLQAMEHGALGFIFMHDIVEEGRNLIETGGVGLVPGIPGVAIGALDGQRLADASTRGAPATVHMVVNAEIRPSTTYNVIGEIPGSTAKSENVVFGTHYDSHDVGPSAVDNASGMAATLVAARKLAQNYRFERTIQVIGFGAEEIGLQGAIVHGALNELDIIPNCRLMVNMDVVGNSNLDGVLNVTGSPNSSVPNDANRIAGELGYTNYLTKTAPYTNTDSTPYSVSQCPTATFGKWPFTYYHTEFDTLDKLDWVDLRRTTAMAATFVAESARPTLR